MVPTAFAQTDDPDWKREKRLHEIYLKYNQSPTKDESWSGVTSGKAQTYSVQKGDTLWDLSSTLFGQGDFWPKVWSLNNERVQNPHEILPSQTIQFYPGTLGEAPQLSLAEVGAVQPAAPVSPQEAAIAAANRPVKLEEDPNPADLPENLKHPKPVSDIPNSLPRWKFRQIVNVETKLEFAGKRQMPPSNESLPYYVASDMGAVLGQVTETEMGGKTAADFQYIYVRLPKDSTEKHLLVIKEIGEIKDPVLNREVSLIEAQGEIEVLDMVNSSKGIYRAIVKKAILPVEVGGKLVVGKIPSYSISDSPMAEGMARVVGGEYSARRVLLANRAVIFLSGQGLDEGKTYPIYKVQKKRNENTDDFSNDRQIGKVKVIQVSGGFATAVVLDSKEEIQIGDVTSPETR